jgi:two-component system chemotaxis response regulator CheB
MKTLLPKPSVPFYKHRIRQSCVVIVRDEGQAKCFLLTEEDSLNIKAVAEDLRLAGDSLANSEWLILGTETWLVRMRGIVSSCDFNGVAKLKPLRPGDIVMLEAKSGRAKVQQNGQKSAMQEVKLTSKTEGADAANVRKVLIVDDSPTMLKMLKSLLDQDPGLETAACVETAEEALSYVSQNSVDVITLDLNLPQMHGVEFLKECRQRKIKVPTVVITSMNLNDGDKVFEALENGAVDYIQKPDAKDLSSAKSVILDKVKAAAGANLKVVQKLEMPRATEVVSYSGTGCDLQEVPVFIGSSTGGTTALERMLVQMTPPIPPIAIVQHIPPMFSKAFAERLNALLPFEVKEAEDGDLLKLNRVLVAPGGLQMGIRPWKSGAPVIQIKDDMPVNRFKPSVDYLFESVSINYSGPKLAIILTGMGRDGASGMQSLKDSSSSIVTIAQSQDSCVVFGMPKAAIDLGCVDIVCNLDEIPQKIRESLQILKRKPRKSA